MWFSIILCRYSLLSSFIFTREHGFSFVRLDGTMSQKRRTQVIQEFQSSADNSPAIMLLSLKAGGVGLNLTAASRVFLMDPVSADFCQELDTFTPKTVLKTQCILQWVCIRPQNSWDVWPHIYWQLHNVLTAGVIWYEVYSYHVKLYSQNLLICFSTCYIKV